MEKNYFDSGAGAELWVFLNGWKSEKGGLLLPEKVVEKPGQGVVVTKSPLEDATLIRITYQVPK